MTTISGELSPTEEKEGQFLGGSMYSSGDHFIVSRQLMSDLLCSLEQ